MKQELESETMEGGIEEIGTGPRLSSSSSMTDKRLKESITALLPSHHLRLMNN